MILTKRSEDPAKQKIDGPLAQFAIVLFIQHGLRDIAAHSGLFARKTLDYSREEAGGDTLGAADVQVTDGRVCEKCKLFDAELDLVKNGLAALDECAAVRCWFDSAAVPVKQAK